MTVHAQATADSTNSGTFSATSRVARLTNRRREPAGAPFAPAAAALPVMVRSERNRRTALIAWRTALVAWWPPHWVPNHWTSSMCDSHVTGNQLPNVVVVNAHRTPWSVRPWRTIG